MKEKLVNVADEPNVPAYDPLPPVTVKGLLNMTVVVAEAPLPDWLALPEPIKLTAPVMGTAAACWQKSPETRPALASRARVVLDRNFIIFLWLGVFVWSDVGNGAIHSELTSPTLAEAMPTVRTGL